MYTYFGNYCKVGMHVLMLHTNCLKAKLKLPLHTSCDRLISLPHTAKNSYFSSNSSMLCQRNLPYLAWNVNTYKKNVRSKFYISTITQKFFLVYSKLNQLRISVHTNYFFNLNKLRRCLGRFG